MRAAGRASTGKAAKEGAPSAPSAGTAGRPIRQRAGDVTGLDAHRLEHDHGDLAFEDVFGHLRVDVVEYIERMIQPTAT